MNSNSKLSKIILLALHIKKSLIMMQILKKIKRYYMGKCGLNYKGWFQKYKRIIRCSWFFLVIFKLFLWLILKRLPLGSLKVNFANKLKWLIHSYLNHVWGHSNSSKKYHKIKKRNMACLGPELLKEGLIQILNKTQILSGPIFLN